MTALLAALLLAPVLSPAAILEQADVEERLGAPVPLDLPFRDEHGREVTLRDVAGGAGRPTVLVLAYYRCPMLCGLVLRGTLKAAAQVGLDGYRFVSVSFDPRDTPSDAQAAKDKQGEARASFLVGDAAAISALTRAVGFRYLWDPATEQFAHPAVSVVLTGDGRISRYLYGVEPPARDLRLALLEAGEGKIGSLVDRVILSCYRWDPSQRRYGPAIQGFFRLGSLLIFVAVAGTLAWLWRRDRRLHA
jgi:protein SCO1/2